MATIQKKYLKRIEFLSILSNSDLGYKTILEIKVFRTKINFNCYLIKNLYRIGLKIEEYNIDLNSLPIVKYSEKCFKEFINIGLFIQFDDNKK